VFLQQLTDSCSALHATATLPSSISQPLLLSLRNGQHTCSAFSHALEGLLKLLLQYVRATLLTHSDGPKEGFLLPSFAACRKQDGPPAPKPLTEHGPLYRPFAFPSYSLTRRDTFLSSLSIRFV
ncbi:hypothetical protein CCUS01_07745, partial [Colletotrichum cuscutae]